MSIPFRQPPLPVPSGSYTATRVEPRSAASERDGGFLHHRGKRYPHIQPRAQCILFLSNLWRDVIMGKIYKSSLELVGHTPLLEPQRFNKKAGVKGKVLVKLDMFNPAGSAKDRIAKAKVRSSSNRPAATQASAWQPSPPPKATAPSSPCRKPCPSNGATSLQPTAVK